MPFSSDDLTDVRDRALAWGRFKLNQVRTMGWRWLRPRVLRVVVWFVSLYRLTLRRPVFIGVTGSAGKTTTKEMAAAVLSSRFTGHKSPGTNNVLKEAIRSVLRTKRSYDYCVQEFGVGGLGEAVAIETQFAMFKPKIGVVTTVGDDHIDAHGSREAIAAEKGKLIAALPANGTAILNADDPLVIGMRTRSKGRVLTYGLSPEAVLRGEDIRADWPNRLSLTVRHEGGSVRVQTQICGKHLVPNVLAAMAVGHVMGVSLEAAASAIGAMPPVKGRMFPIESPDGVTFILDDVKAPVWTFPAGLEFLREATATRKIIIVGNLSDYQQPLDPTYAGVARQALEAADHVFFVGRWASRALKAKRHPDDDAVQAFVTVDHINGFLKDFFQPGDLVLIKGSHPDRLAGIVSTWMKGPEAAPTVAETAPAAEAAGASPLPVETAELGGHVDQLIVGLGNPGKRFEQTPHNVGQRALDLVAESLGATWSNEEFGLVARAQLHDNEVVFVKAAIEMNRTGPWMRHLTDQAGLAPQDCVVVHDDINLKPGVVRNRLAGSSGGHKGMQSIIAAYQSEEIRRVKIGVGSAPEGMPISRYVLSPIEASKVDTIEEACRTAATRVLEMIKAHAISTAEAAAAPEAEPAPEAEAPSQG